MPGAAQPRWDWNCVVMQYRVKRCQIIHCPFPASGDEGVAGEGTIYQQKILFEPALTTRARLVIQPGPRANPPSGPVMIQLSAYTRHLPKY